MINKEQKMAKKLYRNNQTGIIAGVCAGLGEYFDIDPVIIRILWLLMFFSFGIGLLVYIIAWIIVPTKEKLSSQSEENSTEFTYEQDGNKKSKKARLIVGVILLIMGIFLLINQHWYFIGIEKIFHIATNFLIPAILIGIGINLLIKWKHKDKSQ